MPICVLQKFVERNPLGPLLWVGANETMEVALDGLVDALRLTIRLRVVSSAELELRPRGAEDGLPEDARENWAAVGNDGCWHVLHRRPTEK